MPAGLYDVTRAMRGDATIVVSPDHEVVCTCGGRDHEDTAKRIASLLEADDERLRVEAEREAEKRA